MRLDGAEGEVRHNPCLGVLPCFGGAGLDTGNWGAWWQGAVERDVCSGSAAAERDYLTWMGKVFGAE